MAMTRPLAIAAVLAAVMTVFLAPAFIAPAPAHADVEDFSYDSWHVEYDLDLDDEGRVAAHVTETLVAQFPTFDQNRGIIRYVPRDYEGASTDPRDFTVTDESGSPVPFDVERGTDDEQDEPYVAVLTGDDSYVHGRQTYVIEYTLSDVVLARDDGQADEFYWDVLPSARQQQISSFTADIRFAPEFAEHLTGEQRCYAGAALAGDECRISELGGAFNVGPIPLDRQEGVTIAIGMEPGTVAQPPQRLPNFMLDVFPFLIAGAAFATAAGGVIAAAAMIRRHRRSGRGIVVAQYEVPGYLPPLIAAPIGALAKNTLSAQLVHLAVNGAIRFEDGAAESGFFGKKPPQPTLRVVDPAKVGDPIDSVTLSTVFPSLQPGAVFTLPKQDTGFAKKMQRLQQESSKQALHREYFHKEHSPLGRLFGLITLGILAVLTVFIVLGFTLRHEPITAVLCTVAGTVALLAAIFAVAKHRVYTPAGAETREFLEGVKLFIRVAEADRLQMLQSYQGAERLPDGEVNVIHLYEKLLPYAMLFGFEKQWSSVLESWYAANPGYGVLWYAGARSHGVGHVGSTVSGMVSSISNSVSYTSSSSGGAGGGGSVGGGGGGGGAGGR